MQRDTLFHVEHFHTLPYTYSQPIAKSVILQLRF